ncbi:hypothetical protein [Thauera humireducens]|uniref:hypothetical protein n=1 Tax=Thauera humireducens TaxID=1134435 RepID=UPI00311F8F1A
MSKHTPGPWSMGTVKTSCGVCHKVGPFPGRTEQSAARYACLYSDYNDQHNPADIELLANARLIAAAPDLLEALRGMFAMWRSVCRAQGWEPEHLAEAVRAQAAIAKATGGE